MLSFLGVYLLGQDIAVFSGSVIEVFARLGVSEEATRSTLTRMVNRGLLERHRRGRRMYFGLTPRSAAILREGETHVWRASAVKRDWDGTWTLIGFSLPESRRRQRHDLRSRLVWHGFGPLQNGLWISSAPADLPVLLDGLGLDAFVRVFTARTSLPTRDAELAGAAFDVPAIATRYHGFISRWDGPEPRAEAPDDLARQLWLHTDWLQVIRKDPRLPAVLLPPDWPAVRAGQLFQRLATAYARPARAIAGDLLDAISVARSPVRRS